MNVAQIGDKKATIGKHVKMVTSHSHINTIKHPHCVCVYVWICVIHCFCRLYWWRSSMRPVDRGIDRYVGIHCRGCYASIRELMSLSGPQHNPYGGVKWYGHIIHCSFSSSFFMPPTIISALQHTTTIIAIDNTATGSHCLHVLCPAIVGVDLGAEYLQNDSLGVAQP